MRINGNGSGSNLDVGSNTIFWTSAFKSLSPYANGPPNSYIWMLDQILSFFPLCFVFE